jgi:DNA-directed RNA polymerase specialized sigma24 family protein
VTDEKSMAALAGAVVLDFDAVYAEHFDYVYRVVVPLGGAGHAEDLAQEVWAVVHRRLVGFEGRARLTTSLFQIAYHVVGDHIRKERLRRALHVLLGRPAAETFEPLAARALEHAEDATLEDARRRRAERAALLAQVVHDDFASRSKAGVVALAVVSGLGSASLGVAVQFDDEASARTKLLGGTLAAAGLATGVTGIFLRDADNGRQVMVATVSLSLGAMMLGLASLADDEGRPSPGALLFGSAYAASGLMWGVEALVGPHARAARVHRHLPEIATPGARDRVTDAQLAVIERDVDAGSLHLPAWAYAAPFFVAAGVGLGLASRYEDDDRALEGLWVLVGANLLTGFAYASFPRPIERYRHARDFAGLDVRVTPVRGGAALGVSGTF